MSYMKSMRLASSGLGSSVAVHARRAAAAAPVVEDDDDDDVLSVLELDGNLADVEKPPEVPAGTYEGEVQGIEVQTSAKGNKYFAIKFIIPQDELPADVRDGFEDGAVLYWNRQIVPTQKDARAKFNLRKLVEAFGLDSNTSQIDPNDWMGCRARLRIVMGKWQGEERAEIKAIESAEPKATARTAANRNRPEPEPEPETRRKPGRPAGRK